VDLRAWILGDLRSLRDRLAGGVLDLVPPSRWTERVDGGGVAPAYVVWHLARHHDVAVNGVIRGADEVVHAWTDRLGVAADLWRGLAEGEDQDLVTSLDPEAVGRYALAVIEATAGWVDQTASLPDLDAVPDSGGALRRLGTPEERYGWLYAMWDGKPGAFFLGWEAIGHGVTHLGELVSIRNRMGLSPF
jgi:hypothetical protein